MPYVIAIRWDHSLFALTDAGDPQEFADLLDVDTKPIQFDTREQAESQLQEMDHSARIIEVSQSHLIRANLQTGAVK